MVGEDWADEAAQRILAKHRRRMRRPSRDGRQVLTPSDLYALLAKDIAAELRRARTAPEGE